MRYDRIAPLFFQKNRERFLSELPEGSMAIIYAQSSVMRSSDVPYTFRQNSSFFYLSGSEEADSVFVALKSPQNGVQQFLFVKQPNTFDQIWHGQAKDKNYHRSWTAIENVLFLEEFEDFIQLNQGEIHTVYSNGDEASLSISKEKKHKLEFVKSHFKEAIFLDSNALLMPLRMLKGPLEEALLKRAIRITSDSFKELLPNISPGQKEYEVEALLSASVLSRQASGFSFPPIIASGKNSCYLHYEAGNIPLNDGDILLLDIGAEYANYAADICRVIPINGRFSDRQKEVYRAVQEVLDGAIAYLTPGLFWADYEKKVAGLMTEKLLELGLLKPEEVEEDNAVYPAYKRYFMHGISHHIGLDVHDDSDRFIAFEAGNIITVEPGIYIPEEGFGIRLEQMVAIRHDGAEVLSSGIPIDIEEIEALMRKS